MDTAPASGTAAGTAPQRITLETRLTIAEAARLHEQLAAAIDAEQVEIDGSEVAQASTPALQLLSAFVIDRAGHQRTTAWCGHSEELIEVARQLGLAKTLRLHPME